MSTTSTSTSTSTSTTTTTTSQKDDENNNNNNNIIISTYQTKDAIEREVNKIWSTSPGIGVKELMTKLLEISSSSSSCNSSSSPSPNNNNLQSCGITKSRVKAAKAAIPYRYIITPPSPPNHDDDDDKNQNDENDKKEEPKETNTLLTNEQTAFVQQKIQERMSLRCMKRHVEADEIATGLHVMGIVLDDCMKTWTVVVPNDGDWKLKQNSTTKLIISSSKDAHQQQQEENSSNSSRQQKKNETTKEGGEGGIVCQFCNQYFASRNLLFRHLRNVSTSCGNAIFATNQSLPDAPSTLHKRQRKQKTAEEALQRRRNKTGRAKQYDKLDSTLWFGDLPLLYTRHGGQYRRLKLVLREYLPRDVHPQPWIKKVVRKAYRKGGKVVLQQKEHDDNNDDGTNGKKIVKGERGECFGYAIIVFRDAEEANHVKDAMDGIVVKPDDVFSTDASTADVTNIPSFVLKVRNVLEKNKNQNNNMEASSSSIHEKKEEGRDSEQSDGETTAFCVGGQHPPLIDQLRPLTTSELQERCKHMRESLEAEGKVYDEPEADLDVDDEHNNNIDNKNGDDNDKTTSTTTKNNPLQEHDKLLHQTVALYNALGGRKEIHHKGRLIPKSIQSNLLHILQNLRWPASSHRLGLTSDHYLVLQTNVSNDVVYSELRTACRTLMDWVDSTYYYSGIAVTKNFVSSPHVDDRDQTFQYAISLGDFENGGELCVEGKNDDEQQEQDGGTDFVNVVDTRNRIVKVDGRNVHWVRSWSQSDGGRELKDDRYSLIFYDTSDRYPTDVLKSGVDLTFCS